MLGQRERHLLPCHSHKSERLPAVGWPKHNLRPARGGRPLGLMVGPREGRMTFARSIAQVQHIQTPFGCKNRWWGAFTGLTTSLHRYRIPMNAREFYEAGPPCVSRAVDGFVRIGMAGVAWGMFMGSYDAVKEGHLGASRALYVTKSIARNGLGWGCFAGAYLGLNCGVESVRMKKDWINASISGAITGALVSARSGNKAKMLGTSVLVSAIATAGDFLRPPQYPPTGI